MTTESATGIALGLYALGLLVTFGIRTWAHRRATGSSGFRGLSGRPGSARGGAASCSLQPCS